MTKTTINSIDDLRKVAQGNDQQIDLVIPHGLEASQEAHTILAKLFKEDRVWTIDYGSESLPGAEIVEPSMVHAVLDALQEELGENNTLEWLNIDFRGEMLQEGEMLGLAEAFRRNTLIEEAQFSNFKCGSLDARGFDALTQLIESNSELRLFHYYIEELNLHDFHFDLESMRKLVRLFLDGARILKLDLSGNGIDFGMITELATAMSENEFLVDLNLANNNIGADGFQVVCEALKRNESLHKLNLANNHIGGNSATHLGANRISRQLPLIEFNLDDNEVAKVAYSRIFIGHQYKGVDHNLVTNRFIHEIFPYLVGEYREKVRVVIEEFLKDKTEEERSEKRPERAEENIPRKNACRFADSSSNEVGREELMAHIEERCGEMLAICRGKAVLFETFAGERAREELRSAEEGFLRALENPEKYTNKMMASFADALFHMRQKYTFGREKSIVYLLYSYGLKLGGVNTDEISLEDTQKLLLGFIVENIPDEIISGLDYRVYLANEENRRKAISFLIEIIRGEGEWMAESSEGFLRIVRSIFSLFYMGEGVESVVDFMQEDINEEKELLQAHMKEKEKLEERKKELKVILCDKDDGLKVRLGAKHPIKGQERLCLTDELSDCKAELLIIKEKIFQANYKIGLIEKSLALKEGFLTRFRSNFSFSSEEDLRDFVGSLRDLISEIRRKGIEAKKNLSLVGSDDVSLRSDFFSSEDYIRERIIGEIEELQKLAGIIEGLSLLVGELLSIKPTENVIDEEMFYGAAEMASEVQRFLKLEEATLPKPKSYVEEEYEGEFEEEEEDLDVGKRAVL